MGGVTWKIVLDPKTTGGAFFWHDHTIKIEKKYSADRRFIVLIHEIAEAILVNNMMRYGKSFTDLANGDYLFSFNHDQFEIFTDELSGVLQQFMEIKHEKKHTKIHQLKAIKVHIR
jgi:hypothetical protein